MSTKKSEIESKLNEALWHSTESAKLASTSFHDSFQEGEKAIECLKELKAMLSDFMEHGYPGQDPWREIVESAAEQLVEDAEFDTPDEAVEQIESYIDTYALRKDIEHEVRKLVTAKTETPA